MFLYNMLFLLIHSLPCFVIEKMMNNTHGMPIAIRPMQSAITIPPKGC